MSNRAADIFMVVVGSASRSGTSGGSDGVMPRRFVTRPQPAIPKRITLPSPQLQQKKSYKLTTRAHAREE